MENFNLPVYDFKVKEEKGKRVIFDSIRKQYVRLTKEEWVRQSFIQYMVEEKNYPPSLICIEKTLRLNKTTKRADVVVYKPATTAKMIVECKSPEIKINQDTLDQAARYNMALMVEYLFLTNGIEHFCLKLDYHEHAYEFIHQIPNYENL